LWRRGAEERFRAREDLRGGREVRRGEEWRGQGKRRFDEIEQGGREQEVKRTRMLLL
jgi:hypothetical protein